MPDELIGQCKKCGGSLTIAHISSCGYEEMSEETKTAIQELATAAFRKMKMSDKQYTHQIYETAYVELAAGKYSRSDIAALLTHFEELDKANAHKASDWLPADALFDANEAIKKHECKELLIIWWEEKPNQKRSLHWRNATSSAAEASHLLVNMFFDKDHF